MESLIIHGTIKSKKNPDPSNIWMKEIFAGMYRIIKVQFKIQREVKHGRNQ